MGFEFCFECCDLIGVQWVCGCDLCSCFVVVIGGYCVECGNDGGGLMQVMVDGEDVEEIDGQCVQFEFGIDGFDCGSGCIVFDKWVGDEMF